MRTITVTGRGRSRVPPDSAVVRVAAVHQAAAVAGEDEHGRPLGYSTRHSLTIGCLDVASAGGQLAGLAEAVGDRLE